MEVEVPGAGYGFNRALLLFLVLLLTAFSGAAAFVGVNVNFPLGGDGDGDGAGRRLPRAEHVVDLLNILRIQQIKLHQDVHPSLLKALSGSGLQVAVTLPEQLIPSLAGSTEATDEWLREHLLPFLPATNVTGIVVGDRLLSTSAGARQVVKAMRNVYSSLHLAGLDSRIKVTSSVSSDIISELTTPSSATFVELQHFFMHELVGFLAETDSYLMIDVDAYELHLRGEVVSSEVGYTNLVDAVLQSAYTAMQKLGYSDVPVVIGSIGWPWKAAESSASPESAATFNENLVKHVRKAGTEVHVYIQELLDISEDVSSARYGLFSNSLAPRYSFDVKTEAWDEAESVMRRSLADGTSNGTSPGTSPGTTPGTSGGTGQYCVAKPNTPDNILSVGLNWACGQGNADCTPIQQNGPCYLPDTYGSHASYAFNSYYQKNAGAGATCDFNGAAQLVSTDPSYNSCIYTSSAGTSGGGTGSVGSGPTSNGILQPFNPPGNSSSSASSFGVDVVVSVILILASVVWSWRQ